MKVEPIKYMDSPVIKEIELLKSKVDQQSVLAYQAVLSHTGLSIQITSLFCFATHKREKNNSQRYVWIVISTSFT
jgi:hypothetical protein